MLRKLLIIFLFINSCITLSAQRFNGGIIAGGIVSQVDGDDFEGYHKFGFLAGALVSLKVSEHSSFQMELEYIQKGSRKNGDSLNRDTTYLMRLHYIEIPVLYQFTFLKRFSAEIGPAVDISVGSLEKSNGLITQSTVPLRPVTLAGIIGINWTIVSRLVLNFRFSYSLLSIRVIKKDNDYPPSYRHILFEKGQYNNLMSLSLIYKFKED